MVPTIQSLGIDKLPRDQRLELVQAIWDSIAAEPAPALLNESQRQELLKRAEDDDRNPDDVIPWDVVKSKVLGRLKK